jgi:hypothetical protein
LGIEGINETVDTRVRCRVGVGEWCKRAQLTVWNNETLGSREQRRIDPGSSVVAGKIVSEVSRGRCVARWCIRIKLSPCVTMARLVK